MSDRLEITFASLTTAPEKVCGLVAAQDLEFGATADGFNTRSGGAILKAAEAASFKGRTKTSMEVLAPAKVSVDRFVVVGSGKAGELSENDFVQLGGYTLAQIAARKCKSASLVAEVAHAGSKPDAVAASLALGAVLRHYSFRKYQTKRNAELGDANGSDRTEERLERLVVHCANPDKARAAFEGNQAVANGVILARDLMNEPANALGPVEFADRIKELEELGLEVEILDQDDLAKLKMNTLLAVAVGSERPARVAIMHWNGAKSKRSKPLAFVGKGVVFDTGGISIKPASGMEDMKGDMGGAACVVGLMAALAERKAPINAVGLVGLVENMPSGTATRPGDIVTSMSGQTVEILNTDAEGRLVLADVIWYTQERFNPRVIVDLATLTGAIMIALGKEFAGLYVNDEKLAEGLIAASSATGEKIWRMPIDKAYDKMIDSKTADVKNLGGRWGGANTAAAFIHRFVKKDQAWAHLDIAGTAMDAPRTEINTSWGSGWGVRLLDRFVADNYEK
jgi:leucyl aminopeptidase